MSNSLLRVWWLEKKIGFHTWFLNYFARAIEHNKNEKRKLMSELYEVKYGSRSP